MPSQLIWLYQGEKKRKKEQTKYASRQSVREVGRRSDPLMDKTDSLGSRQKTRPTHAHRQYRQTVCEVGRKPHPLMDKTDSLGSRQKTRSTH